MVLKYASTKSSFHDCEHDSWVLGHPVGRTKYGALYAACNHDAINTVVQTKNAVGSVVYRWLCDRCGVMHTTVKGADVIATKTPWKAAPRTMVEQEEWMSEVRRQVAQMTEDQRKTDDKARDAAYQAYLLTPAWRAKRDAVLKRDGYVCQGCGTARAVLAHHLHYQRIFDELLFDLVALCHASHQKCHPGKVL